MFFYNFFKERKKETKVVKPPADLSDIDSNVDDMDEDEIWQAMTRSSGFDEAGLEADDIDDDLDMEGITFDDSDDDSNASEESEGGDDKGLDMDDWAAGAEAEQIYSASESEADADDAEMPDVPEFEGSDFESMDDQKDDGAESEDQEFAGMFDDEIDDDFSDGSDTQTTEKPKRKPKQFERLSELASKLGYKGTFFDTKQRAEAFASADDFEALMNRESASDDQQEGPDLGLKKRKRPFQLHKNFKKGRK